MKKIFPVLLKLLVVTSFFFIPSLVFGQSYRPMNIRWYQLKTPHFRIIYPNGEDTAAYDAGRILESQYNATAKLTGGHLHNFPVVLNDYNDRSNGFVTAFPFHMEVEIPAIKGKSMNPRNGGWFDNVFPHELTHAFHLSVTPWPGISSIIKPFSPDYARSINYNAQMGFHEGLAVYRESSIRPGIGGRGNYAFFNNQFYSNLESHYRWSMSQLFSVNGENRPFNRHYIGGYEFVSWLDSTFGSNTTRNIINFDSRWPFLGLGVAMWHQTGDAPAKLYKKFESQKLKFEAARIDSIKEMGSAPYQVIKMPFRGTYIRRPKWISADKILFYGSFYNTEPGFWIYNLKTKKVKRLLKTDIVGDYRYDVNLKKGTFLYANYRLSPIYTNDYKTDIYQVSLKDGHSKRLTNNARVFSPVYHGNNIWALQTDHQSARWVTITKNGKVKTDLDVIPNNLVAIQPDPVNPDLVAVVANRNGVQGLWIVSSNDKASILHRDPDIAFKDASIFDPVWSHNGKRLLFSAGYGGVMNLLEYNLSNKSVIQVTNNLYNAFEGSYSPDDNKIAFVSRRGDFRDLCIIKRSNFLDKVIKPGIWHPHVKKRMNAPRLASNLIPESRLWHTKRYHTGISWIKPRTVVPLYMGRNAFTGSRFGAFISSSNLLSNNNYNLELTASNHRLWYDLSYQFTGLYPGFEVSLYDQPIDQLFNVSLMRNGSSTNINYGEEKKGIDFAIPIPIVTKQNVQYSSLEIIPKIKLYDQRFIDLSGKPLQIAGQNLGNWKSYVSGDLFASYNFNLQQDIQDAQPNAGTSIYAEFGRDLSNQFGPKREALRAGIFQFVSPLRRFNQSLRLGLVVQTQTKDPIYSTYDILSGGFKYDVLKKLNNVASFSTKYTIPLMTPDNGGFLFPVYFQQIYAQLFTDTAINMDYSGVNNLFNHSRTIYGIGIHFITGLSNIRIDLGFNIAYEPTRNNVVGYATGY